MTVIQYEHAWDNARRVFATYVLCTYIVMYDSTNSTNQMTLLVWMSHKRDYNWRKVATSIKVGRYLQPI